MPIEVRKSRAVFDERPGGDRVSGGWHPCSETLVVL